MFDFHKQHANKTLLFIFGFPRGERNRQFQLLFLANSVMPLLGPIGTHVFGATSALVGAWDCIIMIPRGRNLHHVVAISDADHVPTQGGLVVVPVGEGPYGALLRQPGIISGIGEDVDGLRCVKPEDLEDLSVRVDAEADLFGAGIHGACIRGCTEFNEDNEHTGTTE